MTAPAPEPVAPEPRPLADYLAELPGGGRWGDRRVVKRKGDAVILERPNVDYVVAFDRPGEGPVAQRRAERRAYFNFPTKNRTKQEARAAAEAEFARRTR